MGFHPNGLGPKCKVPLRWIQQIDGLYHLRNYFCQVDTCHRQRALVSAVHIPSHASKVQCMQISEYYINFLLSQ
jgi:hypothetical protein